VVASSPTVLFLGKKLSDSVSRRLDWPRSCPDTVEKGLSHSAQGNVTRFFAVSSHSVITIPTELSRLFLHKWEANLRELHEKNLAAKLVFLRSIA
jgi:hypothetical protein